MATMFAALAVELQVMLQPGSQLVDGYILHAAEVAVWLLNN